MSNAKTDAAVIEIRGQLDEAHRLLQMTEEAAELAQAAAKLARILMGENPSPMPEDSARAHLLEEYNDVRVCAMTLDLPERVMPGKLYRWAERLRNRK